MTIQSTAFSLEIVKIAARKKRSPNYAAQVAALAPAAVVGSLVDIPKGTVEKAVETRVGMPKSLRKVRSGKSWKRGISRFGAKVPANMLTLPVFLSGIKDIQEGRTTQGAAKVVGAGAVYGGLKGGLESKIEKAIERGNAKKSVRPAAAVSRVRGVMGALTALTTAAAIAKNRDINSKRRKAGKKQTAANRYLLPTIVGGVGGAGKGYIEEAYSQKFQHGKIKTPRRIRGAMAGRAAAGALGAAALSEIANWAMKKQASENSYSLRGSYPPAPLVPNQRVKDALANTPAPFKRLDMGPKPGELYYQTLGWAGNQSGSGQVMKAYKSTVNRGEPEANPTRRAVYYALHDDLTSRGHNLPAPVMRDKVNPPVTRTPNIVDAGLVAAVVASPTLVWSQINKVSVGDKDRVLREAMDRLVASKGVIRLEANEDFWNEGVKSAKEEFARTGKMDKRWLRKNMFGGGIEGQPFPGPHAGEVETTTSFKDLRGREVTSRSAKPYIGVDKAQKPWIVAHELGHATAGPLRKSTLQTELATRAYGVARVGAIALPLAALTLGYDSSFATAEELESRAKFSKAIGGVAAVLAAPRLAEEAVATAKGIKYLADARKFSPDMAGRSEVMARRKALGDALRRGSRLLPAFGTYAAPIAAPFIVAKYLSSKAEKARKQQQRRR